MTNGRYPLHLMLMTKDPELARLAIDAGVDRIFVDLEIRGKAERQAGRNTIISGHTVSDVHDVRRAIGAADLMARVDPPHRGTAQDVEAVIQAGANIVMLPMFSDSAEVGAFVDAVDGRARTCLLLETAAAFTRLDQILAVQGVDEIHVGLNDLHLSLGLRFMFEVLAGGLVDHVRWKIDQANLPLRFGFGGGARISAQHPIPPAAVLGEHVRLRSEMIILSRTFLEGAERLSDLPPEFDLRSEVAQIRVVTDAAAVRSADQVEANRVLVRDAAWDTVSRIRKN